MNNKLFESLIIKHSYNVEQTNSNTNLKKYNFPYKFTKKYFNDTFNFSCKRNI